MQEAVVFVEKHLTGFLNVDCGSSAVPDFFGHRSKTGFICGFPSKYFLSNCHL